jgi:hypothetical protein
MDPNQQHQLTVEQQDSYCMCMQHVHMLLVVHAHAQANSLDILSFI